MYKQRAVLGLCWQGCHGPAIPAIPANSCEFLQFLRKVPAILRGRRNFGPKKKKTDLEFYFCDFCVISDVLK